jgi:alkylation response protein AidB-like acyl-CoA dehydrogenase
VDCGGLGLGFAEQLVYHDELSRARVPAPPGTGQLIAGPAVVRYGTEEQRRRWLPGLLRGDQIWAQGYSEPEAGSDLAAVRTTARRDGSEYVVSGQKIWTSQGQYADVFFTVVRTGSRAARHLGISYLLIDARSPGVTVRPLRDLTGGSAFAEIFFDEVRVPEANRIGPHDGGWPLVRTSLGHERAAGALHQAARYRRVLDELTRLLRERGELDRDDHGVRDRLIDFEVRLDVIRALAQRTIDGILRGDDPGARSSISRLVVTAFEQELHEFAVDALGPAGLLTREDRMSVEGSRWLTGFLRTRASTIGAGTAEMQRNAIAERILGLPRDPGMPAAAAAGGER